MKKIISPVLTKCIFGVAVLLCFTSVFHVGYAEQEPYLSQMPCEQFIEKCNQYLEENEGPMRLMPAYPVDEELVDPELKCYGSGITDDSLEHVTALAMYVKHGSIVGIDIASKKADDIARTQMACALLSTLKMIGLAEQNVNEALKKGVGIQNLWNPSLGRNISLKSSKFEGGLLFQIRS